MNDASLIKQNEADNFPILREDFEFKKKSDNDIVLEFISATDIGIDITGCSVILMVKEKLSDADNLAKIKKVVTSHTLPLSGITTISLTDTDTNITAGIYFFDITLVTSDNLIHTVVQGLFQIFSGINQGTVS
jgi:hypothetical protein